MKFKSEAYYSPTKKQQEYAGKLAREIRDRLTAAGKDTPSAHSLAKYCSINTLKAALDALKAGEEVEFVD